MLIGAVGTPFSAANASEATDIDVLVEAILSTHPRGKEPDFAGRIRLSADLVAGPAASDDERIVKLLRVAAAAEDNSTYVYLFQEAIGYSTAPLHAYDFDDGLTIVHAGPKHRQLIGGTVERIAGRPLEEVRRAVGLTISASADGIRRYIFARRAFSPELLHAVGLSPSRERFEVVVRKTDGSTAAATLEGTRAREWLSFMARSGRRVPNSLERKHFWVREAPEHNAIVAEIRAVRDEPEGESLVAFAGELTATLAQNPKHRLVLDFRYGGGGSGHAMGPLAKAIAQSPQARRPGRLYGVVGRLTSGTVLELIGVLRNTSPIVLVGEPASAGPNGVGDPKRVVLPASEVTVHVTEVEWPTTLSEEDDSPLSVDVPVPHLAADFLEGRDRALEAALTTEAKSVQGNLVPAKAGNNWTGSYVIGPGQYVRIAEEGGRLWMTLEDASALVGRNFIEARTPLFEGPDGALLTLLKGVSLGGKDGRRQLRWRGHIREMTPTFWTLERMVLAAAALLALLVLAIFLFARRRA